MNKKWIIYYSNIGEYLNVIFLDKREVKELLAKKVFQFEQSFIHTKLLILITVIFED